MKCFNVVKIEIRFPYIEFGFRDKEFGNSLFAAGLFEKLYCLSVKVYWFFEGVDHSACLSI